MATSENIAYLSDVEDMVTAAKPFDEGNFALFGGESEDGHVVIMDGGSKPSDMRKKDDFSVPDGWLMELPVGGCVWLERTSPSMHKWESHDHVYVLDTNAAWHLRFGGRDLVCDPSIDYDHDSHLEFVDSSSDPALAYRLVRGSRIAFNTDIERLEKAASSFESRIMALESSMERITGGDISVMEYGNPNNLHRILAVADPETGRFDLGVE